ncbi:MAG TPA: hypothetical protein VFA18_14355, partial [Gemmataceae bacterium]|nr:hypothetical protein [Gemmataceae bacterium]
MSRAFTGVLRLLTTGNARTHARLFALFLVVVFLFATWHTNRQAERQRQIGELHHKIVAFIERQSQPGPFSLEDLQKAGGLSDADVQFLHTQHIVYHPVGPRSADDALVLTETSNDGERYYYKNGCSDVTLSQ